MPSASSKQAAQTPNTETSDAVRQVIAVVEKKIRNLEKRKVKLDGYKVMVTEGQELNKDQLDALAKYDEVASNVEFAKELIKHFQTILQDAVKQQKRTAKREHIQRLEAQQKSVRSILELQDLLDQLGNENVRNDFIKGDHGAVTLSEEQLNHLDEFYKLVSPTREEGKQEGSKQKYVTE
ncbi:caprin-1-like [Saccoglossus kowalevskii]|uniref:Caprin-1-like n=1 Tax=Saccoglossus kowalevskii TaxID=10224 RepID=A0ABM0N0R0_SACKO|nr:PREDICTED: caprin-1-like [Saccoglossus kowalevskii]